MSRRVTTIVIAAGVLALAASQSASASRVYAGQPKNTSGFQMVMTLSNSGKKVTALTFHFDTSCTASKFETVDFGSVTLVDELPNTIRFGAHYLKARISGKKLSGKLLGADQIGDNAVEEMHANLTGTVKGGSASGKVAVTFLDVDTNDFTITAQCSETVSWKALRNPGVVYGGKTSQDEPIVLELTSNRKKVSHAHLAWEGPCQTSGFWSDPHDEFDLLPFSLSSTGGFNRTYNVGFGGGSSLVEHFAGKVTKTKAAGSFRGDVTIAGDQPDTCSSGVVSWRANSG